MRWIEKIDPLLVKYELRNDPVIIRVNKFDEESAAEFSAAVSKAHNTGQSVFPVYIDSFGGFAHSLLSMISDIKNCSIPVATIAVGKAMSCGALLLSQGTEGYRFMDRNTSVMIHEISAGAWGKVEELKVRAEESDRLNGLVYRLMAQNCGKSDDYFLNLIHENKHADWYLDAEECKKHNLVNHIRVPTFFTEIKVTHKFE